MARQLKPDERPCSHRSCDVPVKRIGGQWWHTRKAGAHRPRPMPEPDAVEAVRRG